MADVSGYAPSEMDVASWCRQSAVWVVAGKGGVGKTTIAATLAFAAAGAGLSVLVVELEGKRGLAAAFGRNAKIGYETEHLMPADPLADATNGPGTVRARRLTPDDALLEYLAGHGLERVSRRLVSSGVLDVVATAIPGIRDVLVLGKVKQLERSEEADLVVVDAPATGHAMTFLTSASGLLDAARGGPVRAQAQEVVELLQDPARCRVLPVTLPEEMPVSETVEAAYLMEDRVGTHLGPVVVNAFESAPSALATELDAAIRAAGPAGSSLGPAEKAALDEARRFRLKRAELAQEQVERLERELPLPQIRLPRLRTPSIGPAELAQLSAALADEVARLGSHAGAV